MTVLLPSFIRRKRGLRRPSAMPSIREICLLKAEHIPNRIGARVRRSGRIYQVAATQAASGSETPGYVHLSCLGEG